MIVTQLYNPDHRLAGQPVMVKSTFIALVIVLSFLSGSVWFYGFIFLLFVCLLPIFTGIAFFKIFQLLSIPFTFILVGCLTLSFNLQFDQGMPSLTYHKSQFDLAFAIFLRSSALVTIVCFWLLTNSIAEIASVFRKLYVPFLFIELFILSYKFIFFAIQLSLSLYQSQKSRLGWSNYRKLGKDISYLANQVFIRSWWLAKRFIHSLDSRMYYQGIAFLSPAPVRVKESILIHGIFSMVIIAFFLVT